MTFKKIDENTIRCVLTESDMEENDIGLADFFSSNRDKIHDFLENIMERAREEIGYENDGNMLSMQLMPLPNNGLAITITGSRNREFDDVLGNMQNMLKELASPARQADGSVDNTEAQIQDDDTGAVREVVPPTCRIFGFDSLDSVVRYCNAVRGYAKNMKTSLYKSNDGTYYLEISKGRGAKQKFLSACLEANEYAREVECGALFVNNMREHYDCIMAKKVIENTKYL